MTDVGQDAVIDFISGSVGAAAGVYVGQPLDTVKVKMQSFPELYPKLTTCFKVVFLSFLSKDKYLRNISIK